MSFFPSREQIEAVIATLPADLIQASAVTMILLVAAEWFYTFIKGKEHYDGKDTIAATVIGLVNVGISALIQVGVFGVILTFTYLVKPYWEVTNPYIAYPLCIVAIDFCRYWAHRWAHEVRFIWATHVTHHNSPKYNWSVSFRLGWTQHFKVVFFIPAALFGFDPIVFFICHQIEVLYQFWIHSAYIVKLPRWFEYIFVTPSHHRVHHASNDEYLDHNYGSTLIIWDRMFGTFVPETPDKVDIKYGLVKPMLSYNPIYLNFHEWVDIFKDVFHAKNFKQVLKFIFASPTDVYNEKLSEEEQHLKIPKK
ncbi:MAG: sterol desaturase family protein [Flavobacteriales bacterium]|nr:sterol desaturase family protein [Flavobacteriales bacterium]